MNALRREAMHLGLHVALREGGNGEELHGVIDSLDATGVDVWIPDPHYSQTLPRGLRGFLTRLTYAQAEAGAMWQAQPATTPPGGTTGEDLIAFLTWAKAAGIVGDHAATGYRTATRQVLAAQPDGQHTDVSADPAPIIHRFAATRRDMLAPATLAQYASGYRRARRMFLDHRAARQRIAASLSEDTLAGLKALARAWQQAAEEKSGDAEHAAAADLADAVLALPGAPGAPDGPEDDPGASDAGDRQRGERGGAR
jgi:hypothetical protein